MGLWSWVLVALACAGAAAAAALVLLKPAPPRTLTMATGPAGGAYHRIALGYAEALGRVGIRLQLVATAGAVDNLNLITRREGPVDVALVQGGLATALKSASPKSSDLSSTDGYSAGLDSAGLHSIGLLFYEPVWIFHRPQLSLDTLASLAGRKIAIGESGSGTSLLARSLLTLNGVDKDNSELRETGFERSAEDLVAGRIDAVFILAAPDSPVVQRLLRHPAATLFNFERAHGYARHFSHLHPLVLHKGAVDLRRNLPAEDVHLVATTASLVVRASLHPSVAYLLAETASQIHRKPGLFEGAGEFPKPLDPEYSTAEAAERFYRHGAPFLHRTLPFWIADVLERALLLLAPLLVVGLPLAKLVPMALRWAVDRRVLGWYVRLQEIEDRLAVASDAGIADLMTALDLLEAEVISLPAMPVDQTERAYAVRQHIRMVRARHARLPRLETEPAPG